jgi:tripartite-type tricarboxylate transporter receptor subunit TctC
VHWVVSFTAGGPNDTVVRVIGQYLSARLGQQFIIENKVGAGGNIGMSAVLSSPPDGYTIGFAAPNNAIKRHSTRSFRSISFATACRSPARCCSQRHGGAPGRTGQDRRQHAACAVPRLGAGAARLLTNRVQILFDNLPGSISHIKAGKLRALGVTAGKRSQTLPDVPTIAETVPGYEAVVWYGIVAPKGTPPEIVDTLNKAANEVLADPKLKARLAELGGEPMPMTPAQF